MKILNRILTVGVVIPQTVKRPGKLSANGFGICAWNWAISFILTQYARPPLLLPSRLSCLTRLPPRAMLLLRSGCPGKRAASRVRTSLCSQMAPCVALRASCFSPMSDAGKGMEACAWSMRPVSAVVVRVHCANSGECAGQCDCEAAPGECAPASPRRGLRTPALAGLESQASSTGLQATPAFPMGGGAGRSEPVCDLGPRASTSLACTACTFPARRS